MENFTSPFQNLKLDIPEKYNETFGEYIRIAVQLNTSYLNYTPVGGHAGWQSISEGMLFTGSLKQIAADLRSFGINAVLQEGKDGTADSIIVKEFGNKTNLYCHPSMITGYVKAEDLQTFMNVLQEEIETGSSIKGAKLTLQRPVYNIPDDAYIDILIDNAPEILSAAKKEKNFDKGMQFAKYARLERVGDSTCYSSMDTDVNFIEKMIKLSKVLEQEQNKTKKPKNIERD